MLQCYCRDPFFIWAFWQGGFLIMNNINDFKKRLFSLAIELILIVLANPKIKRVISEIVQKQIDLESGWQGNIRTQLWKKATQQTVDYVEKNMLTVKSCCGREQMLKIVFSRAKIDGLYLEFGVGEGNSINSIAKHVDGTVHGFDSFQGLPEPWFDHFDKGMFSTNLQLPSCPENVEFHIGLFDKTLPEFITKHNGQISFIHVDCDLYSSTKVIFDILGDLINSGTVILFDEYFNYPGWQNHEFKAFQEFVTQRGLKYEYLAYDRCHFAVAVLIL
jgi:hypothetical protein